MGYEDYVLFARVIIDLADLISRRSRPEDVVLVAYAAADPALRRFTGRPDRKRSAMIQRLLDFGIPSEEAGAMISGHEDH